MWLRAVCSSARAGRWRAPLPTVPAARFPAPLLGVVRELPPDTRAEPLGRGGRAPGRRDVVTVYLARVGYLVDELWDVPEDGDVADVPAPEAGAVDCWD